ncbi:MAG: bacteriohemerythrin [Dehalococcoidia bacterium]
MDRIVWDESFSVGVAELDEQHKKLIGMINTLIEAKDAKVESELISETLMRMTEYASIHFSKEEEYMFRYGYPEYELQRHQHKEFRKKAGFLGLDTQQNKPSVPEELIRYLREWLTNHILKSDMRYRAFFNERGVT